MPEQENLLRYLDAKFEGVETRINGLQMLWEAENAMCAVERAEFRQRTGLLEKKVGLLENWCSGITAVLAVLGSLLSGIPGWVGKLFAAAGAK